MSTHYSKYILLQYCFEWKMISLMSLRISKNRINANETKKETQIVSFEWKSNITFKLQILCAIINGEAMSNLAHVGRQYKL